MANYKVEVNSIFNKIYLTERLILLFIFTLIPLNFLTGSYIKNMFSYDGLNYINIISSTYSILLIIILVFQHIFKKPYLTYIFGCHHRSDRSYKVFHKVFLLCTRCSGLVFGIFLMSFLSRIEIHPLIFLFGMVPLLIDGFIQYFSKKESTNIRRLITGILAGPSMMVIVGYFYYYFSYLVIIVVEKIV